MVNTGINVVINQPGTYLLIATVSINAIAGNTVNIVLRDTTNGVNVSPEGFGSTSGFNSASLVGVVVVTSNITVTLQARRSLGTGNNSVLNGNSRLVAVRL